MQERRTAELRVDWLLEEEKKKRRMMMTTEV